MCFHYGFTYDVMVKVLHNQFALLKSTATYRGVDLYCIVLFGVVFADVVRAVSVSACGGK